MFIDGQRRNWPICQLAPKRPKEGSLRGRCVPPIRRKSRRVRVAIELLLRPDREGFVLQALGKYSALPKEIG